MVQKDGLVMFETIEEVEAHIGGETVECLICHKRFENVLLHVKRTHGTDAATYRAEFNIPSKYSLAGSRLSDKRRDVGRRPDHAAKIAKQRPKRPRTGPCSPLIERNWSRRLDDFSWHLAQARQSYYRAAPPDGIASWATFQRRLAVDPALRNDFEQARAERPVDKSTDFARARRRRALEGDRPKFVVLKGIPPPTSPPHTRPGSPRAPMYPFDRMDIGDCFDALRNMGNAYSYSDKRQASITSSARMWALRNNPNAVFVTRLIDGSTVRCWRIA